MDEDKKIKASKRNAVEQGAVKELSSEAVDKKAAVKDKSGIGNNAAETACESDLNKVAEKKPEELLDAEDGKILEQASEKEEISADADADLNKPDGLDSSEEEESLADNVKVVSPGKLVLKRFFRSRLSMVGLVTLLFLFLFSFIGPFFSPWGEIEIDQRPGQTNILANEIIFVVDGVEYTSWDETSDTMSQNLKAPPSAEHWLGTDSSGRDIFTRLMYGGRISLTLGFVVVILETVVGVLLGGLAGYFGKWVDQLIMRIVDIFNCLPTLPILLIASALLDAWSVPNGMRIYYLMVILTFFGWAGTARLVRGQILMLREQEYMVAAEATGLSTARKIFKHLIPNVMPQLIVTMTLGLGGIILYESTLSYLGLGVPMPYAAWGTMISAAQQPEILQYYFNQWGPPGLMIVLAVLAFNFVGDGLRDAFDPKMKR